MKIFRNVITCILVIGVLLTMALSIGGCGEDSKKVETATTEIVTTVVSTTIAPTTVKPTIKATEAPTKPTEPPQSEEKVEENVTSEEEENYNDAFDEGEDGSKSSSNYMDDNGNSDTGNIPPNRDNNLIEDGAIYFPSEFQNAGVISWDGYDWTYYSELILPGDGLDIPGRYTTEDGYVCDGDGYVVLAADLSMLSRGTVVETPFGRAGKVYDTGCAYGVLDVYVGW